MRYLPRTLLAVVVLSTAGTLGGCGSKSDGGTPVDYGKVADHVALGKAALESGMGSHDVDMFLAAATEYSTAVAAIPGDATATQASKDQARFFGAMARLVVLADPYSDLNTGNGLNDLGDILDGFGLGGTQEQRANLDTIAYRSCTQHCYGTAPQQYCYEDCTLQTLSATSPTGAEIQAFARVKLLAAIEEAARLLEDVSGGFSAAITFGSETVEFDQADVQFLKGLARAMMAGTHVQGAYDLDTDLDQLQADSDPGGYTFASFLQGNPDFLKLRSAAGLPVARTQALEAVTAFEAAMASLQSEADDQANDFVRLASERCSYSGPPYVWSCITVYNDPAVLADVDGTLSDVRRFLEATGTVTYDMGTPADPTDDVVLRPSVFFSGRDVRSMLPQVFNAGLNQDRPGPFADPTFGGFFVELPIDLNLDRDGDGSPEYFGGYTQFFADYFTNGWAESLYHYAASTYSYGTITFGAPGTFTYVGQYDAGSGLVPESRAGTYAFSGNEVTLTFSTALQSGLRTVTVTADEIGDQLLTGQSVLRDSAGSVLGTDWVNWWRY